MIHNLTVDKVYDHFKTRNSNNEIYEEELHCKLLIKVMLDPNKGTCPAFCVEAMICDSTFYNWLNKYPLFNSLYQFCKMVSREIWEAEGRSIRDAEYQMGTINYSFEHWKLIGWSRFGISKNSRIKLDLNPDDSPAKHYAALLKQASDGHFTASEFKQLMEAVNVGLNVHQVFELQKQIDELKSDLSVLTINKNVKNTIANKGIEKTN